MQRSMRTSDRLVVTGVKLAWGRVKPLRGPQRSGGSGGVRFWGAAAQIELVRSQGKLNGCNAWSISHLVLKDQLQARCADACAQALAV